MATTRTHLENTMLRERGLSQKATYCMSPYIGNVQKRKIHAEESRFVVARGRGRGAGEWPPWAQRFPET